MKPEIRKQKLAHENIRLAVDRLQAAQEDLTDIEGSGFADAYTELGETYYRLQQLAGEVRRLQPTGLFNFEEVTP